MDFLDTGEISKKQQFQKVRPCSKSKAQGLLSIYDFLIPPPVMIQKEKRQKLCKETEFGVELIIPDHSQLECDRLWILQFVGKVKLIAIYE